MESGRVQRFLALATAAALAGCAIAPPPAAVVEPVGEIVCDGVASGPGPVDCYSANHGYRQGLAIAYDDSTQATVGAVGVDASGGFGGSTVARDIRINETVVANAAPRPCFAAAHPGFMAGIRAVGRVARVSARIAGKVAAAGVQKAH